MRVFPRPPELSATTNRHRKREVPQGLFTKCPSCSEMLLNRELEEAQYVCKHCDHHMAMPANKRVKFLLDPGSWTEWDQGLTSIDILQFQGTTSYAQRLQDYQKSTGLTEAVVAGMGKIEGQLVSLAVMDFTFLGGSMGSVVGEKITRAIERAVDKKVPLITLAASGGARMHEGMFSLMQMAKTCAALRRLQDAKLPYLSVMTNPTMGGVTASFATLGDLIVSEPSAMIGFAGARVIRETTQQALPDGFQTAEFLRDHGIVDIIYHRHNLRQGLSKLLTYLNGDKKSSRSGAAKRGKQG